MLWFVCGRSNLATQTKSLPWRTRSEGGVGVSKGNIRESYDSHHFPNDTSIKIIRCMRFMGQYIKVFLVQTNTTVSDDIVLLSYHEKWAPLWLQGTVDRYRSLGCTKADYCQSHEETGSAGWAGLEGDTQLIEAHILFANHHFFACCHGHVKMIGAHPAVHYVMSSKLHPCNESG